MARGRAARHPTWNGHLGYIRRSHGAGGAVGDAGYFKDRSALRPDGRLRDAELLATPCSREAIAASVDNAPKASEVRRDQLSVPLFDIVDRIAGQRWTHTEIAELLVRLSS